MTNKMTAVKIISLMASRNLVHVLFIGNHPRINCRKWLYLNTCYMYITSWFNRVPSLTVIMAGDRNPAVMSLNTCGPAHDHRCPDAGQNIEWPEEITYDADLDLILQQAPCFRSIANAAVFTNHCKWFIEAQISSNTLIFTKSKNSSSICLFNITFG